MDDTASVSHYENVTEDKEDSPGKTTKGRRKGAIKWKPEEVDNLLDIVEILLPIGSKKWELVAARHVKNYPNNQRSAEACRRRYEKLAHYDRPTGHNEIPRLIERAKMIEQKVVREEVIGHSALNDSSDEEASGEEDKKKRALEGAQLLNKEDNGKTRKPETKKSRQSTIANAINNMAESNTQSSRELTNVVIEMTKVITKTSESSQYDYETAFNNFKDEVNERMASMESSIHWIVNKMKADEEKAKNIPPENNNNNY